MLWSKQHLSVFFAQYHLERGECIGDEGCVSGGEGGGGVTVNTVNLSKPTHSLSEKQSGAANFRCTSELLLGAISAQQVQI